MESLGEEDWDNENTPNLFYKDNHHSNANTNTHDQRAQDMEDQEDILSDYIPNEPPTTRHKASDDNLRQRYMQSI